MSMSETIEWHRADEVLPEVDTNVLVIQPGEVEVWPAYLDGERWWSGDGWPLPAVLFWAEMPEGPAGVEQCAELESASPALAEAQKAADFNFDQYQDAGAELCKLAEQRDALFNALENCRLLAARNRDTDLGKWILGFCADVGVTASAMRNGDSA